MCKCDCGTTKIITASQLNCGHTKSCGCLSKELKSKRAITHNKSNTRIYKIWASMKRRCYTKTQTAYSCYGGRGIQVCNEWLDSFVSFYEWAINNGYQDNLTLDRIDVNGNYEPGNCRWVTQKQQNNNTRKNKYIYYNGETHTLSEWSEILNLKYKTVFKRYKDGFCLDDVFYNGDFRKERNGTKR